MDRLEEAREVLRRARQMLLERLVDRVAEGRDEIWEDALSGGFTSEIQAVYEQIGLRLSHVNQLISNLPEPTARSKHAAGTEPAEPPEPGRAIVPSVITLPGPPRPKVLALPAPATVEGRAAELSALSALARQVRDGDLASASTTLQDLIGLDDDQRAACLAHLAARMKRDERVVVRLVLLGEQLAAGFADVALLLLEDCFGLSGPDGVAAIENLQWRLSRSDRGDSSDQPGE